MSRVLTEPPIEAISALFVVVVDAPSSFVRTNAPDEIVTEEPALLTSVDLRAAQRDSSRLVATTPSGRSVLPVAQVFALEDRSPSNPCGVAVPCRARSVASLAVDLHLLDIAHGVVVVAPGVVAPQTLCAEIVDELSRAGYRARTSILGWDVALAGVPA